VTEKMRWELGFESPQTILLQYFHSTSTTWLLVRIGKGREQVA
jgi:hypothetical protein